MASNQYRFRKRFYLASDKHNEYLQLGLAVHKLAFKSKEIYEKALVMSKRLLLSQLFTNLTQNRLEIKPVYTKAAAFLGNWIPKLNYDYELAKSKAVKGKEAVFAASSPHWLASPVSDLDE